MTKLPTFDPTDARHFVVEVEEDLDADYYERADPMPVDLPEQSANGEQEKDALAS